MKKEKLLTILGPTAVGKTELSVYLAKILGSSIISAVITTLLSILTKHLTHIIWIRLPVFYIPLWDKTSKKRMAETAVRFFEVFSAQRPFGGIKAPDACHVPV